jgi:hypothetical protein
MEATVSLARYFVFPSGDRWVVGLDGMTIAVYPERDVALHSAIVMADLMGSMRHDADVLVEADGRLDFAWTYGTDPLPQTPAVAA